nr:MAG TPA: hypothetical protein [Caudoviricetes sp.]
MIQVRKSVIICLRTNYNINKYSVLISEPFYISKRISEFVNTFLY